MVWAMQERAASLLRYPEGSRPSRRKNLIRLPAGLLQCDHQPASFDGVLSLRLSVQLLLLARRPQQARSHERCKASPCLRGFLPGMTDSAWSLPACSRLKKQCGTRKDRGTRNLALNGEIRNKGQIICQLEKYLVFLNNFHDTRQQLRSLD